MKNITKKELLIIADNNSTSVLNLIQERKQITKKHVQIMKAICISFIIILGIASIIF